MAASTRNASQRSGATTRSRAEGRRYQPPTPKPRKKKAKKKAPTPPAATAAAPSPAPAVVSPAPVQAPQVRVDTQGQVADSATDEEASQGAPVEFDYGDNFILDHSLSSHLVALGIDKEEHRTRLHNILGDNVSYLANLKEDELSRKLESIGKNSRATDDSFLNAVQLPAVMSLFHFVDYQRRQGLPLTGAGMTAADFRLRAHEFKEMAYAHKNGEKKPVVVNGDKVKFNGEKGFTEFKKQCMEWHGSVEGVDRVPLTYLLRENDVEEVSDDATYDERILAHASLSPTNPFYRQDAKLSHTFFWEAVKGTEAQVWVEDVRQYKDGRKDWLQILKHYEGAGNVTRRLHNAEATWTNVKYVNERTTPFIDVVKKLKKAIDIFKLHGQPKGELEKVRKIVGIVRDSPDLANSPTLSFTVGKIDNANQDRMVYNYARAISELSSAVCNSLPSGIKSSLSIKSVRFQGPASGIFLHGKIHTDYWDRDKWRQLSRQEQKQVIDEREKQGKGGGKGSGGRKGGGNGDAEIRNQLKQLTKTVTQQQKTIASLQATKDPQSDSSDSDGSVRGAGSHFGGRNEQARAKKRKRKN